jgi:hypothetical protein
MTKSIIEEALLEAEKIQESLKKNTKEILAATMRQEIDNIVKESFLSEQDEDMDVTDVVGNEELENVEVPEDESGEETSDDEFEETSEEGSEDDASMDMDVPEMEDEISDDEVSDMDMDMGDDESHEIDLTNGPIQNVIKVFKNMSDEDEIEIVKDGKNVNLKDNKTGAEYQIQLDESTEPMYEIELDEEEGVCNECDSNMYGESDEPMYEIELDEEDTMVDGEEDEEESEVRENKQHIRYNRSSTFGNNMKTGGKMEESYKTKMNQLIGENKNLKVLVKEYESKQGEYKNALKIFRDKLNEIALFNTNLTYATKLFTEHSTTKQEKANILKRFDSVVDLKESKNLHKSISDELVTKTPINESIDKKVNKTVSKGSVIKESTVYVDPQIKNIQNLMDKLDNRV